MLHFFTDFLWVFRRSHYILQFCLEKSNFQKPTIKYLCQIKKFTNRNLINFRYIFSTGNGGETFVVRQDENQRRAEFRKNIDLNGDGKADRRELLHYIAPQSPRHSEHEAEALLALADSDQDNMLSLDEILNHPDLFLKSKMVDTGRSFHDEFWSWSFQN